MAINKTVETSHSVIEHLNNITSEKRRGDCFQLVEFISKITGFEPRMWGTGIVGFGSYHYEYASGREGDAPLAAIAARTNAITIYFPVNFDQREELLEQFGKYKTNKGCVYIQKLEDIHLNVLAKLITNSIAHTKRTYP